ncbi:ATP-binding protein, partial [Legionella pneumophila serogroup 1]
MSKLNQIQSKLLELDGGAFQRLCDDWLHKQGYKNINCIGTKPGTYKSIKGTPDSIITQPDGSYIFVEFTVQQTKVASKIKGDIQKCLDESKTKIQTKDISEIIVCYLGKLSSGEIHELKQICKNKDITLILNSIDTIAYSIKNDFPSLANEYLSLPLDSGQLLSIDDFIKQSQKNPLSTPIDKQILFMDEQLKLAKQNLMENNFLLIAGPSGIGKTLFAINLIKSLCENQQNLKTICVFNKGAEIYGDIISSFSEAGDYLIFIDDANRLDNRLDYIFNYLNETDPKRTFRIIATTRDYAKNYVLNKAENYIIEPQVIEIEKLTDDQIKTLIEENYGIKNVRFQQRIQEIAKGNPRLAVMAALLAIEKNNLSVLHDVTSLYKEFFKRNEEVLAVLDDPKLLISACAISFFRTVDRTNEDQMIHIQNTFEIQAELFWECANDLHNKEIVDIYENEVVKFSDQVLSSYMLFMALFEKKLISFSTLMRSFYPQFKRKIIDAINPIIRMFDQDQILPEIKKEIKIIFDELKQKGTESEVIEYLNTFWFVLPTESLLYAKHFVSSTKHINIEWNNESFEITKASLKDSSIISLLSNFRHYKNEEFITSLELLLLLLERNKGYLSDVIKVLVEQYSFEYDDWIRQYYIQEQVVELILNKIEGDNSYLYTRLFILIAKEFLKVEFHNHQWTSGKTINFMRFRLAPNENIKRIREKIIAQLSSLLNIEPFSMLVHEFFQEYAGNLAFMGKEMAEADFSLISNYLVPKLDNSLFLHCLLMQDLRENYESLKIPTPSKWETDFANNKLILFKLLLEDRHEKALLELSTEEYQRYRHEALSKYFMENFKPNDFPEFLSVCCEIRSSIQEQRRGYTFKQGMLLCLHVLSDLYPEKFYDFISTYTDFDKYFELIPEILVQNLLKNNAPERVWELINKKTFPSQELWISFYFILLPQESIQPETIQNLLSHYRNLSGQNSLRNMCYLEKYVAIDKEIFIKITEILLGKASNDSGFAKPLESLFDGNAISFDNLFTHFLDNQYLIFKSYIAALKLNRTFDYSGHALNFLTTKNKNFIREFIDCIFDLAQKNYSHPDIPQLMFVWERDDYLDYAELIVNYLYENCKERLSIRNDLFKKLLQLDSVPSNLRADVKSKIYVLIKNIIIKNSILDQYVYFIFDT